MAPTRHGFRDFKLCSQYLASYDHIILFILIILITYQISSDIHGLGIKLKTVPPIIVYNSTKTQIMTDLLT